MRGPFLYYLPTRPLPFALASPQKTKAPRYTPGTPYSEWEILLGEGKDARYANPTLIGPGTLTSRALAWYSRGGSPAEPSGPRLAHEPPPSQGQQVDWPRAPIALGAQVQDPSPHPLATPRGGHLP